MPIADMTGAAANRIGVARDLGRYNQGQKDQLLGGVAAAGDIGASVVEAQHRTKMEQMLQEQGFDPATAKQLIAAGPHAAASALLQKKRDAQQEAQRRATAEALGLAGGVNPATQHAGMGGGSGGAASQGRAPAFDNAGQPIAGASAPSGGGTDWGSVDPSAMEFLARQRADAAKTEGERKWYFQKEDDAEKRAEAARTALGGRTQKTIGALTAPVMTPPLFGGVKPGWGDGMAPGIPRKPDAPTMLSRIGQMPPGDFEPSAIPTALRGAFEPKAPKAPELSPYDETLQRLRAQKEMGAGDFKPEKPVKPTDDVAGYAKERGVPYHQGMSFADVDRAYENAHPKEQRDPLAMKDAVEKLKLRMEGPDLTKFERLQSETIPKGWMPVPADAVANFEAFQAEMLKKYPDATPRTIGGGGGDKGATQPPGDPKKVQALQAAGWTWDGTKWNEPAK